MDFDTVVISLPIEDRARSHRFYRAVFDSVPIGELAGDGLPEPFQFEVNPGLRLMLVPRGGFGYGRVAGPGETECILGVTGTSEADADDVIRRAVEAGGRVVVEPSPRDWGYTGSVSDPDAHVHTNMAAASMDAPSVTISSSQPSASGPPYFGGPASRDRRPKGTEVPRRPPLGNAGSEPGLICPRTTPGPAPEALRLQVGPRLQGSSLVPASVLPSSHAGCPGRLLSTLTASRRLPVAPSGPPPTPPTARRTGVVGRVPSPYPRSKAVLIRPPAAEHQLYGARPLS